MNLRHLKTEMVTEPAQTLWLGWRHSSYTRARSELWNSLNRPQRSYLSPDGGPEVLEQHQSILDFGPEAPSCSLKEVSDICRHGDVNGTARNLHRLIQERQFYKKSCINISVYAFQEPSVNIFYDFCWHVIDLYCQLHINNLGHSWDPSKILFQSVADINLIVPHKTVHAFTQTPFQHSSSGVLHVTQLLELWLFRCFSFQMEMC